MEDTECTYNTHLEGVKNAAFYLFYYFFLNKNYIKKIYIKKLIFLEETIKTFIILTLL